MTTNQTSKRVYQNLKHISTSKLVEILCTDYSTTDKGTDYGPVREELEQIFWERKSRLEQAENNRRLKAMGKVEKVQDETLKSLIQVQAGPEKIELPALPGNEDELDRTLLICEIRESWRVESKNGFGFIVVDIPPRIMPF